MLSEKAVKVSKFDRTPLAEPMTYRVVFRKTGNLQYFSHLDLQRTWQRVLVRASIPMWYTLGFNPHAKIVFGIPLPVGTEGLCEMVDLRVDREITAEEMKNQLNAELTDEMAVGEVYVPTTSFNDIIWGTYEITIRDGDDPAALACRMNALLADGGEPIVMSKRTKSGDKDVDIRPMIRDFSAVPQEDGTVLIRTTLAAGNTANLSPEFVITAMKDALGILADAAHPDACWYRILRTGFLTENGGIFR